MSGFDESNLEPADTWSSDNEDSHSVASRARIRAQLEKDIQAYLQRGGKIQQVETRFRSDPPRKAEVGFNNRSL